MFRKLCWLRPQDALGFLWPFQEFRSKLVFSLRRKDILPVQIENLHANRLAPLLQSMWRIVRLLLVAYLLLLLLMMIFEESFIFFPTRYNGGPQWRPPGLAFEDVFFTADDGTRLHAWYLPHDNPRAVILFAHGNAGNLADRAPVVEYLRHKLRSSVMIFDYRGYGRSEGTPDEQGVLADARAARRELARRAGVDESDVVLLGRSIGGAVMVDLAAEDGARGLVLQSTFSSMPELAAYHYPWLPVRTFMRTRLESIDKISRYHGPLLQSHGDADNIIPDQFGRRLFEAANEPKQFFVLPGGNHNDPDPPEYLEALDRFIGELGK